MFLGIDQTRICDAVMHSPGIVLSPPHPNASDGPYFAVALASSIRIDDIPSSLILVILVYCALFALVVTLNGWNGRG